MNSSKPRVAIFGLNYAPEPTGIAPYTTGLARGLAQRGYEIQVFTGYPHYPEWQIAQGYTGLSVEEFEEGVSIKRMRHFVPAHAGTFGRVHMEASFGARLAASKWREPDVVVCVTPALIGAGAVMARRRLMRRSPSVGIWVQDLYGLGVRETGAMSGRSASLAASLEARILGEADGIVVIHDRFREHVVGELGIPADRTTVIRNWSHVQRLTSMEPTEVRSRLGWGSEETIVLHAGNMGMKQGLESVVEAARLAEKGESAVRFVLMGNGNQRQQLEAISQNCANIDFVDPLSDEMFLPALNAADILLVNERASLAEMAVPSKLTSYFASGRPVLAATSADSVTASEIQISGGGMQVAPEDPQALLDGVDALASDAGLATKLGEAGRKFRQSHLTMETAVDAFEEWVCKLSKLRDRKGISVR
ncbi:glycosyltransferase [Rhodococcus sp. NPDC060090]|uniref:glycosyltransferase n=1 Tax=Rhodococcus sp. NPDC060090 TaxID=3347056 RepID=UPI003668DB46